jgi:hypothetical protein
MNVLSRNISLRLGLLLAAASIAAGFRPAEVRAAAPVASLDVVPADAAFYSAMLRNREQFDAIANSRALAKVKALPMVQMGLSMYQMQAANPDSPAGWLQAALDNPESRKSLEFLADIFSDEVFVYGGPSVNKAVEVYQSTYWATQFAVYGGLMQTLKQQPGGRPTPPNNAEMEEIQGRALVQALVSQTDAIEVPELVVGMKVKDKGHAEQLLDRLETEMKKAFATSPLFDGRFKRETVAGHSYLTLTLDGGMVPWDGQIEDKIRSLAASPADGDKLIDHLKKMKLVISLGLRDEFLLVTIGPSTKVLTRLGGPAPLRSREELAAVAKFANRPITSVAYSSKKLNQHFSPTKADLEQIAVLVKNMLPALPVPAKLRDDLGKSTDELVSDLKTLVTEIGATTSVGFFTKTGMEHVTYDWSDYPEIDSSQPLDLLKHVGGKPIAMLVSRSKVSSEGYDVLVKWVGVGYRYLEEYGVPQMPKDVREHFDQVMPGVKSLAARLDKATRDSLLPALADGQSSLVLDARLKSNQFIKTLPRTDQALPMLEPAIVVGVSDAAKLKAAFAEYYDAADEFVEVIKAIDAKEKHPEIPKDFKLPRPKEYKRPSGTVYGYALPKEAGVDAKVMPNAGLSEKVAVLSMSGQHTDRLLRESNPVMAGIKLPLEKPYGTVAALDFAALVEAASPWVDLAIEKSAEHSTPQDAEMIRLHAKAALEVLKCYRGTVSTTAKEGKATVTRTRSEFHDIGE